MEKTSTIPGRLLSIDALRGFDMFFIMGGSGFFFALAQLFPCGFTGVVAEQMNHVDWDGFAWMDMIFPLFLFISGISFPFSYAKSLAKGLPRSRIYLNIMRRMLVLIALGIVYNGFFALDLANLRYASVLARIGIAWAVAAAVYTNLGMKWRLYITAAILLGYWALIALIPAPDVPGASPFSFEGNLVGYIDRLFLPGRLYEGTFDPESILSALPAVATALLGMTAGDLVKRVANFKQGNAAVLLLAATGAILLMIGLLWDTVFPINKKLWSSSYVCFAGGLSFLLFSLFYYLIDVLKWRRWTLFFKVVGMNSITIYMAQHIIRFGYMSEFFGGGLAGLVPESVAPMIKSIFYIAVCWLFLYFLYRRKIFLKV